MPTKHRQDNVASPNLYHNRMQPLWDLVHDLCEGTIAMREAGEKWLPREPLESPNAWKARVDRSFLFGAFADTIEKIVAKPFAKDAVIQGDVPDQILAIKDDIDGEGQDLTQFLRGVFSAGVTYGLTHVLVDFPAMPEGSTLQDVQDKKPTFVHITPPMVMGWKSEVRGGTERLTEVRIKEVRHECGEDSYLEKEVHYMRVYTKDSWAVHKRVNDTSDGEKWIVESQGSHTFGEVPLVTFYTNRIGFMQGLPPLERLAWENVCHWQSYSDQRNVLRFARVGILFAAGFTQEEVDNGIEVGPKSLIATTNAEAKLEYVEHKGQAIKAGREDVKDIEERMVMLGMQPFIKKSGNMTATGESIGESKQQSLVHAWVRSLENACTAMFEMAAGWYKSRITLPDDFKVDINTDFGLTQRAVEDIEILIKMRQAGDLSRKTFLEEVKRRGVLAEHIDVEQELMDALSDSPGMGGLDPSGAGLGDDEEEDEGSETEEVDDDPLNDFA